MFAVPERKKPSRVDYSVEEEIMEMLFRLNDKKSSELFRMPVDARQVPDYYTRITSPMDLNTIAQGLKDGRYYDTGEVYCDLNLIISNCLEYNYNNFEIIKKAESFRECIKTEWGNFMKEMQRKVNVVDSIIIDVTPEVHERLLAMEEKRRRRKAAAASANLLESDSKRRFGENEYEYYAHLNSSEDFLKMHEEKTLREDPFSEFETKVDNFHLMTEEERRARMRIELDEAAIADAFEVNARRKLDKYRKILAKKIGWCERKILRRIMTSKKYAGMSVPPHLIRFIEEYDMVRTLNIRRLQLFVKQIAYWMKEFQHVLGDRMKEKFLAVCRTIRKCIVQVVRYRRIQHKSTKIKLENPFLASQQQEQSQDHPAESTMHQEGDKPPQPTSVQETAQEKEGDFDTRSNLSAETKSYEQKMKEFRRLLERDVKEDRKKDTKVLLVIDENGDIVSRDPIIDDIGKKLKPKKIGGKDSYRYEPPKEDEQRRRNEEMRRERQKDMDFLEDYNKRSNLDILSRFYKQLSIDWEADRERLQLQKMKEQLFPLRIEASISP